MIRGVPTSVWALRVLVLLGPLGALFAAVPVGHAPPAWLLLVVAATAVVFALLPESMAGPLVMVLVLAWWAFEAGSRVPAVTMLAAACLVVSHVAAVVLGYGPASMPVDPAVLRRWAGRAVLMWLASPVIWFVARVYADSYSPTSFWLAGLAVAILGAVVAATMLPAGDRADR